VPEVSVAHIHQIRVSVREHAGTLREKLLRLRTATFRALCADCQSTLEVVARFLALLELYREGMVSFEQVTALGELTVRWTGADDAEASFSFEDEYDAEPEPAAEADTSEGVEPVALPEDSEDGVPAADDVGPVATAVDDVPAEPGSGAPADLAAFDPAADSASSAEHA